MPETLTQSEYDREMARWNAPYTYQPFPKTLFRARHDSGRVVYDERIVQSERELSAAGREGWIAGGPLAAKAALEAYELEMSTVAAEVAGAAQKMSAKAKREFEKREAATAEHVTE